MRIRWTPVTRDGRLRDVQNWIGGSDYFPRNARFVPPPPEAVSAYMDDLLRFINRDDLSALTQAAIANARFESSHAFTTATVASVGQW